jgi:hypothetical protein
MSATCTAAATITASASYARSPARDGQQQETCDTLAGGSGSSKRSSGGSHGRSRPAAGEQTGKPGGNAADQIDREVADHQAARPRDFIFSWASVSSR